MDDGTNSSDCDSGKKKFVNRKTLGSCTKIKVEKTILSSDEEIENHSSYLKSRKYFASPSKGSIVSDKSGNRSYETGEKIFETIDIKSEQSDDDSYQDIQIDHSKTNPEMKRKRKRHKVEDQVEKKKFNTLMSFIYNDENGSDSDNDDMKPNDSFEVCKTSSTSDRKHKKQSSTPKLVKNPLPDIRDFDLKEEAEDVEEMINNLEEENQVPQESLRRLHALKITFKHTVPPQHKIESCAGSRGPTLKQKKEFEKFGPIKYGKFSPEEDDIIVANWKSFCKLHNWDYRDVKPFLYLRHRDVGFVTKFTERQKFVQFLADGLPWRTLYSVYWRFRNLHDPHLQSRYTEREDKLIIAHMENSSAIDTKNVRKFSQLGKILNRTRASVWRRYQLIKQKRDPDRKIEWNLQLVTNFIKNLMKITRSENITQLKDLDIPFVVWEELSKKLEIDYSELKEFWLSKLHMQLFCSEPIYLNDVKIKLIEYFFAKGINEWWEINWQEIAQHFDGMTSIFLSLRFSKLIQNQKHKGKKLSEILEYLYEVKRPKLQQASKDKCLQRLVFKNGKVKPLDVIVKEQPHRRDEIADSSD